MPCMRACSNFIYRTSTNRTASGKAVVKIYCVPVRKLVNGKTPTCSPRTAVRIITMLLAIDRISQECGFGDLLPRLWVDRVRACACLHACTHGHARADSGSASL